MANDDRLSTRPGTVDRRAVLRGAAAVAGSAVASPLLAQGRSKSHLNYGIDRLPPNMRAFEYTGTAHTAVKNLIHRGLMVYDGKGALGPDLAESYTFDGDLAYEFKLRRNARFHDGAPVTADDVKFSLTEITRPGSTAQLRSSLEAIGAIDVVDPGTVRIKLKQPVATFLNLLAHYSAPIVPAKAFQADKETVVGAGPFRVVDIQRGTRLELKRFDGYYKPGLPKLDTISVIPFEDESLRVASLESGDVDFIVAVPWQFLGRIKANERLATASVSGAFTYVVFNVTAGPFKDPRVRQAVGHALRREDFVKAVFSGQGSPLQRLPIPADSPYYDGGRPDYWEYDLDKARRLLAEAGYPNGFSTTILATSTPEQHRQTAEIIQQQLKVVGIECKLNIPEWSSRITQGNRGQYGIGVNGTALDFNDPDGLATLLLSDSASYRQSFGYKNREIESLLLQGRAEIDAAKRKVIYGKLEELAAADVPFVPIAWRSQDYAFARSLKGFSILPGFLNTYSSLTLEEASLAG